MKARLPKGYGGGPNNIQQLARQAQKLQDDMEAASAELETKEYTANAGGGAVSVTLTGKKTLQSIELKKEVVDPEDIEMLQDLIISAVNEAVNNIEETTENEMSKITGGVALPGLF